MRELVVALGGEADGGAERAAADDAEGAGDGAHHDVDEEVAAAVAGGEFPGGKDHEENAQDRKREER